MSERRGLELELARLRDVARPTDGAAGAWEMEVPAPPGEPLKKIKKPLPKGGPEGQIGKTTPTATGSFEPDEAPATR